MAFRQLKKITATISGLASDSFRSEVSDWSRLTDWAKHNPARWVYGILGLWLSVFVFRSHDTQVESFIAENRPLNIGEDVLALLSGIWLVACMFSFFSQKPGMKWLRRSLLVLFSSSWLLNSWEAGAIGIFVIIAAWLLFVALEHAVVVFDETSHRVRWVRYVLLTLAISGSLTSPLIVIFLHVGSQLWYSEMFAVVLIVPALTMWSMWSAYRDRSDPQGPVLFNRPGLTMFTGGLLFTVLLSEIVEMAFGIPHDLHARSWWIEENWGVSGYFGDLMEIGILTAMFAVGGVAMLFVESFIITRRGL